MTTEAPDFAKQNHLLETGSREGEPVILLPHHLQDAVADLEEQKGIPVGTSLAAIRAFAIDGIDAEQLPYIVSSYLTGEKPAAPRRPEPTPKKTDLNAPRREPGSMPPPSGSFREKK
jgi:hypothetical protein